MWNLYNLFRAFINIDACAGVSGGGQQLIERLYNIWEVSTNLHNQCNLLLSPLLMRFYFIINKT